MILDILIKVFLITFVVVVSLGFIAALIAHYEQPDIDNLAEWERSERYWRKLDGPK